MSIEPIVSRTSRSDALIALLASVLVFAVTFYFVNTDFAAQVDGIGAWAAGLLP